MSYLDRSRLDGRVAVVTGAAQGIGRVIGQSLSQLGARVALADAQALDTWPPAEPDLATRCTRHQVDVRSMSSCHELVRDVLAIHGRLDHLVNAAGIVRRAPAAQMSELDFTAVLDVNLTGTFRMAQAAYDALRQGGGSIVNLGSTNGQIAVPNSVGYCVSKAGVLHLTRVLALEWAVDRIRVNAVAPTIVATSMTADVRADPEYLRDKLASIPLGRMAEPQDVADAVTYLLGPTAGMVTGHTIFVDGGVTVR